MISPKMIGWNSKTSVDFGVITELAFDGDSGDTSTNLTKDPVYSESYNGTLRMMHGYKYSEVLSVQLTLVKPDGDDFTREENRAILAWLTSKNTTGFLSVYCDDTENISYEILGNFIEVSQYKLGNGRIVGYICTFESISPYAYSPLRTTTVKFNKEEEHYFITPNSSGNTIEIYTSNYIQDEGTYTIYVNSPIQYVSLDSDELESLVYPKITITTLDNNPADTIEISNGSILMESGDPIKMVINGNKPNEVMTIDGANRLIYSSLTNRIFGDTFNWRWLPFTNGTNAITIYGRCDVIFEWRDHYKVGQI